MRHEDLLQVRGRVRLPDEWAHSSGCRRGGVEVGRPREDLEGLRDGLAQRSLIVKEVDVVGRLV